MSETRTIRIATRTSPLALWQANAVKQQLELRGHNCELVLVESGGDMDLTQPIYAIGITGVFTKQLDITILENKADIAVHSLKDVPTRLAENIFLAAVLERGAAEDVVLVKDKTILEDSLIEATVATSSLRRRAQWLEQYPKHRVVPIRGNVQTRLSKFEHTREIDVIIFAKAGLQRMGLLPESAVTLDWMLPAPAQGTIGIVCREDDEEIKKICNTINHRISFITAYVERQFLQTLMGGCSVPISAWAEVNGNELNFRGAIHSFYGQKKYESNRVMLLEEWHSAGKDSAEKMLQQPGAPELLHEIKTTDWDDDSSLN